MTRLDAYRIKRLHKEADALLRKASRHPAPHVQSQFQIGYVPPLEHLARNNVKPRLRYWLVLVAVIVTVVCINVTAPQEHAVGTVVAGK